MDDTDIQILNILQKNARIPVKELAKKINLSSPAAASRIHRLENEGIIMGYQAQVNPVALGMYTKAFICLEVAPVQKQEFYPYIRKCKHVVECNCVTGEYSMLLEVLFENTMELDQFIGELQRFGRTKTLIVFSTSVEHRGAELS
ncbi:MAG: Lrp/AsnC family transcriptional regulator [Roseburia sp.]